MSDEQQKKELSALELDAVKLLAAQLAPFANNGQVLREILRALVAESDPDEKLLQDLKREAGMTAA